jgi:hypothetical protein
MGKGGQGSDASAAAAGEVEENMAAWLVAKNTLKIMPFKLPPLGTYSIRFRLSLSDILPAACLLCSRISLADYYLFGAEIPVALTSFSLVYIILSCLHVRNMQV